MSSAGTGHVPCVVTDGVAHVRLDRPDKLNALTLPLLDELVATARRLRRDRHLRAVAAPVFGPRGR